MYSCFQQFNRGVLLRRIASSLIPSPSGLCLIDSHLFVSSGSHCIIKLTLMNDNEDVELRYTVENPSAGKSGWYRYVCKVSLSPSLQNRLLATLNNSDLLVTRAILERSYLLFCAMRSCLTQITTEGNQEKHLTKH